MEKRVTETTAPIASLLAVADVASYFNVHVNTVRHWCKSGRIGCYCVSNRGDRRFSRKHIDEFLKGSVEHEQVGPPNCTTTCINRVERPKLGRVNAPHAPSSVIE